MQTTGQTDYEKDLKDQPNYHDGTPRKTWVQLGKTEQDSWNRANLHDREASRLQLLDTLEGCLK